MQYKIQTAVLAALLVSICCLAPAAETPLGNMTPFKTIAEDTLKLVEKNDLKGAKARIKDLETTWDNAEPNLKGVNPATWSSVDKAIDLALKDARSSRPNGEATSKSLKALIAKLDAVHKK